MAKSNVNSQHEFLIEKNKEYFVVNGEKIQPDIHKIDDTNYHIIHKNKSYRVSIVHVDIEQKKIELTEHGPIIL